jgi:hypothetical protein
MAPNFLSVTWISEAFCRLGAQDLESLILFGALFLLGGGWVREGKKKEKKNRHGEGGFPWSWTCLAGCIAGHSC